MNNHSKHLARNAHIANSRTSTESESETPNRNNFSPDTAGCIPSMNQLRQPRWVNHLAYFSNKYTEGGSHLPSDSGTGDVLFDKTRLIDESLQNSINSRVSIVLLFLKLTVSFIHSPAQILSRKFRGILHHSLRQKSSRLCASHIIINEIVYQSTGRAPQVSCWGCALPQNIEAKTQMETCYAAPWWSSINDVDRMIAIPSRNYRSLSDDRPASVGTILFVQRALNYCLNCSSFGFGFVWTLLI